MHGAASGPGSAGVEPTAEALDSVLSRFQDWSKNGRAASKGGPHQRLGRGAPTRKANLTAGARELSYEQALRATSYRRQGYEAPAQMANPAMPTVTHSVAECPKPDSTLTVADRVASAPRTKASSSLPTNVSKNAKARPVRRVRVVASPMVETLPAVAGGSAASESVTLSSDPAQSSAIGRRKNAGKTGPEPSGRAGRRTRMPRPDPAAVVAVGPRPTESTPHHHSTLPEETKIAQPAVARPAFREVLQKSAGLEATAKDSALLENKTVALSLRVSDVEQARIQACAARANVSVSAYLRQCALGVEELRGQVRVALGELRERDALKAAPPGLSAIPGILRDAAVGWFRRLRGGQDSTGLSLR